MRHPRGAFQFEPIDVHSRPCEKWIDVETKAFDRIEIDSLECMPSSIAVRHRRRHALAGSMLFLPVADALLKSGASLVANIKPRMARIRRLAISVPVRPSNFHPAAAAPAAGCEGCNRLVWPVDDISSFPRLLLLE